MRPSAEAASTDELTAEPDLLDEAEPEANHDLDLEVDVEVEGIRLGTTIVMELPPALESAEADEDELVSSRARRRQRRAERRLARQP